MPLSDGLEQQLTALARSGFYTEEQLQRMASHGMTDAQVGDEAAQFVRRLFNTLRQEQSTWPAETDCERIDRVFAILQSLGLVVLQNAGESRSEGYQMVLDIHEKHPRKSSLLGYCLFHRQDLLRVMQTGRLCLAFGTIDPAFEDTQGVVIGHRIATAFQSEGFAVDWNGTFAQRIVVTGVDWKRRLPAAVPTVDRMHRV